MFLRDVFSSVKNMNPEEVREYLSDRPTDAYTLLDVRTPQEYEQEHIPGSVLIPISELADRMEEIDREKPVIAY